MSRGIGVRAELIMQDNDKVIYKYGSFNWNRPECMNRGYDMDGQIIINKIVLPKIEFYQRNSKKATQKKGPVKRVIRNFTVEQMIENEYLIIKNSKYCWHTEKGRSYDVMAIRAAGNLISQYEDTGEIPDKTFMLS